MDRDFTTFAYLAAGKAFVLASGLAYSLVVGRLLGPEGLGQWSLLLAAGAFVHAALVSWTHPAIVRFGCEEWELDRTLRRTLSSRLPLLILSLSAATALLLLQPGDWLSRAFGVDRAAWALIGSYAFSLWVAAEAQAVLQATGRINRQAAIAAGAAAVSLVALLAAAITGARRIETLFLAVVLPAAAVWGITWLLRIRRAATRWEAPSMPHVRRQFLYGVPLLFGFAVGYLSDWGDHLLLGVLSSRDAVGHFGLAYQGFLMLTAGGSILTTIALPRLIASHVRSDHAAEAYLARVVPTVLVLWAPLAIGGVAIVPPLIRSLAGPEFARTDLPLMILCAVVPAQAIVSLYTVLFNLQERLTRVFSYAAAMALLNLTISAALIPTIGVTGAAIGTAASYVFGQFAYIFDQHRHLGVPIGRVVPVWLALLALGAVQVVIGPGLGWRFMWGVLGALTISWVARRAASVDAALIDRFASGPLSPVGLVLRRALVGRPTTVAHSQS